ncbi:hypothetical protein [Geomonas sp.]|uniref:hypothetical protein n=1 Tax=Geomonas sp. TaxID=2651584 RepID=UPI002B478DC3|nr:hypothetical protein [Geomonas sp.]HJV36327.1 hypothetical protein [Geomonas sp.]
MNILKSVLQRLHLIDCQDRNCRTRRISDAFFECRVRVPNPNYCEHSRCSGDSFICNHHDREMFAAK